MARRGLNHATGRFKSFSSYCLPDRTDTGGLHANLPVSRVNELHNSSPPFFSNFSVAVASFNAAT